MSTPIVDQDAAAKAVFWAKQADARDSHAAGVESRNPEQAGKLNAVRSMMHQHRRAYRVAEASGVPKGHRLQVPGEDSPQRLVGGSLVFTGEKFLRIGDADEQTPLATPYPAREIATLNRSRRAEEDYAEHADAETGMGWSPEEFERHQADRSTVRAQSHEIARRLESVGKNAYRNEAFSLWVYYVHSKQFESIPNFRRICLLPYVAAMVRASKLAALEYFLDRNPFARFWTFTTGARVGEAGLRERCQWLTGRLNRLNLMLGKRWGGQLVFRSTEFGTVEFDAQLNRVAGAGGIEFDENGAPLFHVHAHCVFVSLVGFIPPKKWDQMIREIWDFWGHHWDAGSIIRDARECCKYVTKPADMLKLSPEQLGHMHEAVFRLKLCQPLGVLADEIRARKKAGKTLRRYRTREGLVWREVFDQNKHAEMDEQDRWATENLRDAQKMAKETIAAARVKPGTSPVTPERNVQWCRVFARLSPSIGPRGLKEPRVIVGGTHRSDSEIVNHPLVSRLWAQTVEAWEAGLRISVHTGTPTGIEPEPFSFFPDVPERVAPPGEPLCTI